MTGGTSDGCFDVGLYRVEATRHAAAGVEVCVKGLQIYVDAVDKGEQAGKQFGFDSTVAHYCIEQARLVR